MIRARIALAMLALAAGAPAASADFPQDPPNDPQYASPDPVDGCLSSQQWELFDYLPSCAPGASDPQGRSGIGAPTVWREHTTGDPAVVIAYIEAGVNWHAPEARDIVNQVYLNAGELPAPTTPDEDAAVVSVKDYGDTSDANGNGYVDGEDVLVRFRDGRDTDSNGYVDDISGWDTYDDQPDAATGDSAYRHSDRQMDRVAGEADNGIARVGTCPRCRLLPIKAGAEALVRSDDLAEAFNFAADAGASVVVSETADLGYSTLMRQTVERLDRMGVVMVIASNDFDSRDHQGGMFHPHALPANGVVPRAYGTAAGESANTNYLERSTKTSWGVHNVLSVSSHDGSTSASAPPLGGAVGLIQSVGRGLDPPLSPREAVQVLKATAYDVNDPSLNWPSAPGWDEQYGYGRVGLPEAAAAVTAGRIPPTVAIDSPAWYRLHDPARRSRVRVRGRIEAPRSPAFTWTLEAGSGPQPADEDFRTIARGRGSGRLDKVLGQVDLARLPAGFADASYRLSSTKTLETAERYAVTLRLRASDQAGNTGEDRRAFYVRRDDSMRARFPRRIGPGGESQPALVDLRGLGRLQLVFGDADGRVHAIDPRTGRQLRGFPVRTARNRLARVPDGVRAGNEPIVANVAVGDLDGRGRPSVVAATTTGRLYAWDHRGRRRRGFPIALDRGHETAPIPRPREPRRRGPRRGSFAAPVLVDLDGNGRLDIVQAAWDGHVYAVDRAGRALPGWPLQVRLPETLAPPAGYYRIQDLKLSGTPAVADLDGDTRPELVVRGHQLDVPSDDPAPLPYTYAFALRGDGTAVPGWPVRVQGVIAVYGTAQEFITEGIDSPVAADVDGDGDDEVAVSPALSPTYLLDGDGSQVAQYGPSPSSGVADVPVTFTTSGAFGRFGGGLTFAIGGSAALSIASAITTTGAGAQIVNVHRAYEARGGASREGFPARLQGLDFLGGPIVADVTGDGEAELLEGGDTNALHAYTEGGAQAAGFPKWHSGWTIWAPSAGDLDSDGRTEIATTTREGDLFVWNTPGRADANDEWWRWHHDEWSTGRYGTDTRPPRVVRGVRLRGRRVSWLPSGDDWATGRAARYRVALRLRGGRRRTLTVEATRVTLPRGTRCFTIQGIDDAGNVGHPSRRIRIRAARRCR